MDRRTQFDQPKMSSSVEVLSRHDRRKLSEAFYSVQGAADELQGYFVEISEPTDATSSEVVEMLTASAKQDAVTLDRAVHAFIDVVSSFVYYDILYQIHADSTKMLTNKMAAASRLLVSHIEAIIVRLAVGNLEKASEIAFDASLNNAKACQVISKNAETICFNYTTHPTMETIDMTGNTFVTMSDDDDESFDSDHDTGDEDDEAATLNTTNFIAAAADDDDDKRPDEQHDGAK